MFKLLKRDLFQELLCLKFLIKLMRYYGRADLKICELGGEGISYAELYTVTPEIDPDYYFNPKTNTLEYGKDHFRQPLFQFTEGRLLDRSLWYAFKARRSDSNAFLASVPSKSTPVYDMLYKTLLMAYYTRGFSVYQDHGDVYFKCDYPTQTRGLANAVKYLSRKASAARLVLNHIALHTSAGIERRIALKALQLQSILVSTEHDDYHIGNVLWSNIELLKGVV
jgi:hypothetical protein